MACTLYFVSNGRIVMDNNLVLKNRLKEWRSTRGMSQEELARAVGATRQTIISIEKSLFNPSAKLALLLCVALDVEFEKLFYF